jgi:hypothetical protein
VATANNPGRGSYNNKWRQHDACIIPALLECVLSIPEVAPIRRAAFDGQHFTVKFCPEEEIVYAVDCSFFEQLIRIRSGEGDYVAIESFLFELCNGANRPVWALAESIHEYADADAFTRAVETAEFETGKVFRSLCPSLTSSNAFVQTLAETYKQTHDQIRDGIVKRMAELEDESFDAYLKCQDDAGHTGILHKAIQSIYGWRWQYKYPQRSQFTHACCSLAEISTSTTCPSYL